MTTLQTFFSPTAARMSIVTQLARIEAIGLHAAAAAIHVDPRGIDDGVGDPAAHDIAMQPEAVAPRFVAAPDRRAGWYPKCAFARVISSSSIFTTRAGMVRTSGDWSTRVVIASFHSVLPSSKATCWALCGYSYESTGFDGKGAWNHDFYAALLPALGAPDWHGRNLDGLNARCAPES